MKKFFALLVIIVVFLTACNGKDLQEQDSQPEKVNLAAESLTKSLEIGDSDPVSLALAAKMAALAIGDLPSIRQTEREIPLSQEEKWHDKYINYLTVISFIASIDPERDLTIIEAQGFLDKINPDNTFKIKIDDSNKDKLISYALWSKLYLNVLKEATAEEGLYSYYAMEEESIIPLATKDSNSLVPDGYVFTDKGLFSCEGLDLTGYIDKEVSVIVKNGEIVCLVSVTNTEPVIKNAYIVAASSGFLRVFCGGAEREYEYSGNLTDVSGKICNIKVKDNECLAVEIIDDYIHDEIKKINGDLVELAEKGSYKISPDFKVYSTVSGAVKWKSMRDLIVGSSLALFSVRDGVAQAAVIESRPEPVNIRVVIKNGDFSDFYHNSVTLSGTQAIKVTTPDGEKTYGAGEKVTFSDVSNLKGRAYIEPVDTGLIAVESVNRSGGVPKYRGKIEVSAEDKGFIIVNELPIEEYLYAVVPSEMPNSYGLEALKVQAVTARSYAYNQYYSNLFHQYGANVCDSVISQVYNNIPETELSIRAVNETGGICLTYEGSVISANFFSTSSGMTANNGEVWANSATKEFPAETSAFLSSAKQYTGEDYGDLTVEANAAKFFKAENVAAYDSFSSWFRWNLEMTNEELTASINANLASVYKGNPRLVKTLQPDGQFKSRPVGTIGKLVTLEVVKRGQGGNIMELKITGTENTVLVSTEYNIRTLLRPKQYLDGGKPIIINRSDNTQIGDYSLMPSAFFTMERMTFEDGSVKYVRFYGGGNGHGVGMSQVGVKGMVDAGFHYTQIMEHYYKGTTVEKIY